MLGKGVQILYLVFSNSEKLPQPTGVGVENIAFLIVPPRNTDIT